MNSDSAASGSDDGRARTRDAGDYVPMPSVPQQWLLMTFTVLTPLLIASALWWLILP